MPDSEEIPREEPIQLIMTWPFRVRAANRDEQRWMDKFTRTVPLLYAAVLILDLAIQAYGLASFTAALLLSTVSTMLTSVARNRGARSHLNALAITPVVGLGAIAFLYHADLIYSLAAGLLGVTLVQIVDYVLMRRDLVLAGPKD